MHSVHITYAAMNFLEQRPVVEDFEKIDETAPSWVATVANERLCVKDPAIREPLLKAVTKERCASDPLIKFLFVFSPNGTQAFVTWKKGLQNSSAKLFFKKSLSALWRPHSAASVGRRTCDEQQARPPN